MRRASWGRPKSSFAERFQIVTYAFFDYLESRQRFFDELPKDQRCGAFCIRPERVPELLTDCPGCPRTEALLKKERDLRYRVELSCKTRRDESPESVATWFDQVKDAVSAILLTLAENDWRVPKTVDVYDARLCELALEYKRYKDEDKAANDAAKAKAIAQAQQANK